MVRRITANLGVKKVLKSPAKSDSVKTKSYCDLFKVSPTVKDDIYIYATVLDAQFPHKSFKSNKYVCSLKICDSSCPVDKESGLIEFYNLVMFANKFEDLPIVSRVGEVIRVNRAQVSTYGDKKQFTANLFFKASWALFPPLKHINHTTELDGVKYFGKTFNADGTDIKKVRDLRKWSADLFSKHHVLSSDYFTKLAALNTYDEEEAKGHFDLQVKVCQLMKLDKFTAEIRVVDESGEFWHCQLIANKYNCLKEGDTVRIRQATL